MMGPFFFVNSFFLTGAGHGIYGPLAIVSSPLGLFGIHNAFWGLLLLWPIIGFVMYCDSTKNKILSSGVMFIHYAGILLIFLGENDWNDWSNYRKFIGVLIITGILYLISNIIIWDSIFNKRHNKQLK